MQHHFAYVVLLGKRWSKDANVVSLDTTIAPKLLAPYLLFFGSCCYFTMRGEVCTENNGTQLTGRSTAGKHTVACRLVCLES